MLKKIVILLSMFSISVYGAVALSNVKVKQRYPWNGKVDISFKFDSTRSNNTVRITAIDRSTGGRLNVVNLFDENGTQLNAPIKMAPGEHRIVWDADKDLEAGFRTESLAVSVSIGKYFEYPLYCVIDISGGKNAASWPVSYMNEMPEGGWTDEYKRSKLLFRLIQPGSFIMGPGPDAASNIIYENQHRVTLTKPYYINVFELSKAQWQLITTDSTLNSVMNWEGGLRSQLRVSYYELRGSQKGQGWPSLEVDSDSVIGILRAKSGLQFLDLPSEAQWEYACRAGTTTAYNNGLSVGTGVEGFVSADVDIGSFNPNAWGLYDFHSGAGEWCGDYFKQELPDAVDPMIGREAWNYHPIRGLGSGGEMHRNSNYRYFDMGYVPSGWSESCGARFVIFLEHNQE